MHIHVCRTCNAEMDQCDLDRANALGFHEERVAVLEDALRLAREAFRRIELKCDCSAGGIAVDAIEAITAVLPDNK